MIETKTTTNYLFSVEVSEANIDFVKEVKEEMGCAAASKVLRLMVPSLSFTAAHDFIIGLD